MPLVPGPDGFLRGPTGQATELPKLLLQPMPAVRKRPAAAPDAGKQRKQQKVEDIPNPHPEDGKGEQEEEADEDQEGGGVRGGRGGGHGRGPLQL